MHANKCPVVRETLLKTRGKKVLIDSATPVPVKTGVSTFASFASIINEATVIEVTVERKARTVGYSFNRRIGARVYTYDTKSLVEVCATNEAHLAENRRFLHVTTTYLQTHILAHKS